mgnify:CR=1 FL=1
MCYSVYRLAHIGNRFVYPQYNIAQNIRERAETLFLYGLQNFGTTNTLHIPTTQNRGQKSPNFSKILEKQNYREIASFYRR